MHVAWFVTVCVCVLTLRYRKQTKNRNTAVIPRYSGEMDKHKALVNPLCESMTSVTKPVEHNVSQRRQRRIKRGLYSLYMHRKSGEVWVRTFRDMRADRRTDK